MADSRESEIKKSTAQRITQSKKDVTILFTDIEDSTSYWHKHGDVDGRLMVDRHNRILFPIVKRFRGSVVKTIGDSIMAMFKQPDDALLAAIAMQQALRKEHLKDADFEIKIRIGIHTGEAIVEQDDVYGDVVNIAARIEEQAKADEIALSSHTRKALDREGFIFARGESFIPKGKKRKMALSLCKWEGHEELVKGSARSALIPITSKQKLEVMIYLVSFFGFKYLLYKYYLRYFLSDNEYISTFILNPSFVLEEYVFIPLIAVLGVLLTVYGLIKMAVVPYAVFKFLKGSFVAGIVFIIFSLLLPMVPKVYLPDAAKAYYITDHLIVNVLNDNTAFYERPSRHSKVLFRLDSGDLMLLTDVKEVKKIIWNKVLVRDKNYAWVQRVTPPRIGVPRTRVTRTNSFVVYHRDIYMLVLALLGFLWGYRRFTIKPF